VSTTGGAVPTKAVSLDAEVNELEGVVTAVGLLVDLLAHDQWGHMDDVRRIPRAASAVLALLGSRMRLLARVLRREEDAAALVAPFNVSEDSEEGVVLPLAPSKRARRGRS